MQRPVALHLGGRLWLEQGLLDFQRPIWRVVARIPQRREVGNQHLPVDDSLAALFFFVHP